MKKVLAAILLLIVVQGALRGQNTTTLVRSAASLPASCQQGTAIRAAELINVNGALYLCSGPSTWRPFAQAPNPTDAIRFVSPNGKDSNDGLSWGSAKLTIMAAYDALPVAGGVVYFTVGVAATSVAGQGMWICGPGDASCFASPPTGWRKQKGSVDFIGVGSIPLISAGSSTDNNHPAIWLSGTSGIMAFDNLSYEYPNVGIRVGCTAAGDCTGPGGASGVMFRHIVGHINQAAGTGPNAFVGSNSFWITFEDCGLSGNAAEQVRISAMSRLSNLTTVTTSSPFTVKAGQHLGLQQVTDPTFNGSYSVAGVIDATHFTIANTGPNLSATSFAGTVITDKQIPIVVDPGSGSGSGLIFVTGQHGGNFYSMGAARLWPGTNGGGIYLNGITVEGDFAHVVAPPVWIGAHVTPTQTRATNIELADPIGTTPVVEVDNSLAAYAKETVVSALAGGAVGPLTWVDGQIDRSNTVISPLRQGQQGFFSGRVEARSDVGRGMFSPVAAPVVNLANTNPSSWSVFGGAVLSTGITAPDGTTGAGQIAGGLIPGGAVTVSGGPAIAVGVTYVFGMWVRSQTANGYGGGIATRFDTNANGFGGANRCNNSTQAQVYVPQRYVGDGQWEYASGVCKITAADATAGLALDIFADGTHTVQAYAPVVLGFASGAISDNEAYELANNLAAIPTNCTVASVCMMPGQAFSISGSTQFMGLFTHANRANRTYTFPDLTGTVGLVIGAGSTALNTSVLDAPGCQATINVAVTGVTTSTRIQWNFASDPSIVPGYGAVPINAVHIYAWPTAGSVNFKQCSAVAVTPGAINILWNAYN